MSLPNHQLSFAAGSNSLDPHGYRVIDESARCRLTQLTKTFPILTSFLNSSSLIISAYPAALGLTGLAPFVDTYLHPETFIRAMRLAVAESRPVVLVAQPLVGADLILQYCRKEFEFPSRLLWASGGYPLPISLEKFVLELTSSRSCDTTVLHSYGVAEIGHSCFAAMDRFDSGIPRFKKVATEVTAHLSPASGQLSLKLNNRCVQTGDTAKIIDGDWEIESGRLDLLIREELESWSALKWERRTGYLIAKNRTSVFQLREGVSESGASDESHYHKFWHLYGGSLTAKPLWNSN